MIQWQPRKFTGLARRINTAIAWSFGMVALGLAIQVARAVLHIILGSA